MKNQLPIILIVDQDESGLGQIRYELKKHFTVKTATDPTEAESILGQYMVQCVVCDTYLDEASGIDFLRKVKDQWPNVIQILTSKNINSVELIHGINHACLYRFLYKPLNIEDLVFSLNSAVNLFKLGLENKALDLELKRTTASIKIDVKQKKKSLQNRYKIKSGIIYAPDSPMHAICETLVEVGGHDVSVLLTGESGTGKELCARALHYSGARRGKTFIVENCAALPDELLESELFGYKKGAFTGATQDHIGLFAQANNGTIFLDEIGDVSPAFQVKLLRVLQENEIRPLGSAVRQNIDVRVIAATNKNLEEEVFSGRFREDLYYRLATITISVPPLRDRPGDIPIIANAILESALKMIPKNVKGFTDEVMDHFTKYPWPGNIREMQNEIHHMLILSKNDYLGSDLLTSRVLNPGSHTGDENKADYLNLEGTLKQKIESLETDVLRETLAHYHWNKSNVAKKLGISRVGLNNKISRYGIEKV